MRPAASLPALRTEQWGLRLLTLSALSIGGVALLLHAAGWLTFQFVIVFAGPPAVLVLLGALARARQEDDLLLHRLQVGLVGGIVGTAAYDLARLVLLATGLFRHNLFSVMPIFGSLATGLPPSAPASVAAGWTYHVWNGVAFAGMYGIVAGPASWGYGVAFGMLLEAAYMGVIPGLARVSADTAFVTASVLGHGVYGAVLGRVCERFIKE